MVLMVEGRLTKPAAVSRLSPGWPIRSGLIDHEAVDGIFLMQKIAEGIALQLLQFGIRGWYYGGHGVAGGANRSL